MTRGANLALGMAGSCCVNATGGGGQDVLPAAAHAALSKGAQRKRSETLFLPLKET